MSSHHKNMVVESQEVQKFSAIAKDWWDADGPFAMLHRINPVRLDYIVSQISQIAAAKQGDISGVRILDVACGGGLVSVPLARLGAIVDGIDASAATIEAAKLHAQDVLECSQLCYYCDTLKAFVGGKEGAYDVVLLLEIVEHLDDVKAFLETAESILKPGGIMIISTINRTIKSMIMAKIGAEYILHIVPTGTHDWNKFCKPEELVEQTRLQVVNMRGMEFSLRRGGSWVLSDNMDVNYFITLRKL